MNECYVCRSQNSTISSMMLQRKASLLMHACELSAWGSKLLVGLTGEIQTHRLCLEPSDSSYLQSLPMQRRLSHHMCQVRNREL